MMGEVGLISVGAERNFSRYSIGGLYGIVPSEYSEGPVIETVALRQTYRYYDWDRISTYVGLNIYHIFGLDYQSDKFRDSPGNYYQLGGFRGLVNLGLEIEVGSDELGSFYTEAGMNDLWIVNILTNRNSVNPLEHISLAMGFKHHF
jgi:hypothetical protein